MSELSETYQKSDHTDNANSTSHYVLITISVVIGLLGVFLRFLGDWTYISAVSNILLAIGTFLALKAVFNILK